MSRIVLALLFLLFVFDVEARHYRIRGDIQPGRKFPASVYTAHDVFILACRSTVDLLRISEGLAVSGSLEITYFGWGGLSEATHAAKLANDPYPATTQGECEGFVNNDPGDVSGGAFYVDAFPDCVAGAPGTLIQQTTITGIDTLGRPTYSGVMPNPQCRLGCVEQQPTGGLGTDLCSGYTSGATFSVGELFWVSCAGDGIAQTGASCNFTSADQFGVAAAATIPASAVPYGEGSSGGGGLSGDESANLGAIASNTAGTVTGITVTNATLAGISTAVIGLRNDGVSRELNAEGRHSESMSIFNAMKSALESIDTKTGTGGSSGIPADGFALTGEVGGLGADPVSDVPVGGLKSPGEDALTGFKDTLNATGERVAGTCPTWTLVLDYFDRTFVIDSHCQLFETNRVTFETIMTVVWSVMALGVVLRA